MELAKVDTDANPDIARAFGIQGIPNVKAFRDGDVVDEFVGVKPPAEVERFFDSLVPSEADALAAGGDEASLRRAVELDPEHAGAAMALARLLLRRGDQDEAKELLDRFEGDFTALGLQARLQIQHEGDDLAGAFAAWDEGDFETALESLQGALQGAEADRRDLIRRVMVAIFDELGPGHELAQAHRRRLASALY